MEEKVTGVVGKYVATLMHSRTQAHVFHLQTVSYTSHKALNEYYEKIIDIVDRYAEVYQGKYGVIRGYVASNLILENPVEINNYFEELSKFINGVDTVIGDEGSFLSGGQRQRVGIARAIYHSRDIMVLDEATTGLDTKLEEEIIQSVYDLCKDKTLFIISHNHKILSRCNKILQIKDGKIKELQLNL